MLKIIASICHCCIIIVEFIFAAPPVDLSDVKLEPDEGELELQLALNKARKLKQIEDMISQSTAERVKLSWLFSSNLLYHFILFTDLFIFALHGSCTCKNIECIHSDVSVNINCNR